MNDIPIWVWYVIGLVVFVLIFLYMKSSQTSVGKVATTMSSNDLANYAGNSDLLLTMLDQQGHDITDLKKMQRK